MLLNLCFSSITPARELVRLIRLSFTLVGSIGTLIYVSTDKAVRDAANEGDVLISQNGVERCLQNDLYTAISEFNGMGSSSRCFTNR